MKHLLTCILTAAAFVSAVAERFSYSFRDVPVADALVRISKDHPDISISFIYKELDAYRTSASIRTDDSYEALQETVGLNPISIVRKRDSFYLEALQHGTYRYTGRTVGTDGEPVAGATVYLLAPKDSTVITYGITDGQGCFSIPCDRSGVIGKVSCIGYRTATRRFDSFAAGTITMAEYVHKLKGITVEADHTLLYPDKSVYIPTSRQKNSSLTATDLLHRMAIPQLRMGDGIETVTRQPVEIFIDYVPATSAELDGMRMEDVRRVEYYDYPADPRFQGKAHVINFIMQKYEYGGYVKGYYTDSFVTSRQANAYAKVQYRKMVFDWAGNLFFSRDRKTYENTSETFRLPQEDGTVKEFTRDFTIGRKRLKSDAYWTSFKALYSNGGISMSNMITLNYVHTPAYSMEGRVTYTPEVYPSSEACSYGWSDVKSVAYNGYWYFQLPAGNYLTFTPRYAFTSTVQEDSYAETGFPTVANGADDASHQASGNLSFVHSFGKAGNLKASCEGKFLQNRTRYSGTSDVSDLARTYRVGPGISYSYADDRLSVNSDIGMYWDRSAYGTIVESSATPWVKLSGQYSLSRRNSLSVRFSYSQWEPSSSYRSAAVIRQNPFFSYTGNPSLVPFDSYSFNASYTFLPTDRLTLSAYGFGWIVGNRYVYDYEAEATGIIRTIKQPLGSYRQWQYGLEGSLRLLGDNLSLRMEAHIDHVHNGEPYNWTKMKPAFSLSAYYYLKAFYFGATYSTPQGYADGCMVGTWMDCRASYSLQAGWADGHWNVRLYTANFLRHDTWAQKGATLSRHYDSVRYIYASSSEYFHIAATYTFGFGKKVKAGDEAYQASGAASGILK